MVDVAVCVWRNVALSALLFGAETIVFNEATIKKLEAKQGKWARETLRLPVNCPGLAAQVLLGAPSVRQLIYKAQLKYFMRLNKLPASRYAAQALREHEAGGWESPYLGSILKIMIELGLVQLPLSGQCLD